MIEEDRYCLDISNQLQATASIIKKANTKVLSAHLQHCVKESFETGTEPERTKKMDEMIAILIKNSK